jgi:hypothetical protein
MFPFITLTRIVGALIYIALEETHWYPGHRRHTLATVITDPLVPGSGNPYAISLSSQQRELSPIVKTGD